MRFSMVAWLMAAALALAMAQAVAAAPDSRVPFFAAARAPSFFSTHSASVDELDFSPHLASIPLSSSDAVIDPLLAAALGRLDSHVLAVRGFGVQLVSSDTAELRVTIEHRREITDPKLTGEALAAVASDVQRKVAERTAKVVDYLKEDSAVATAISKLRTSAVTIRPEYTWRNNERVLTGYVASTQIIFQVEIEQAGQVMDAIIARGVTSIDSLKYFTSPPRLQEARQSALAAAMRDALAVSRAIVDELRRSAPGSLSSKPLRVIKVEVTQLTQPEGGDMPTVRAYQSLHRESPNEPIVPPTVPIIGAEQRVIAEVVVKVKF